MDQGGLRTFACLLVKSANTGESAQSHPAARGTNNWPYACVESAAAQPSWMQRIANSAYPPHLSAYGAKTFSKVSKSGFLLEIS
ncbi:hypothetical protein ElyMa_004953300 [Elysia marginata]|uniref:Uncharacterized protein n=1 Tax=Elysia marginata TaxID=1093978 RepID=A0AAV4J1W3_9GAST|nr:hypothetical protein ElyMa_004953300 [Elysia marginata]